MCTYHKLCLCILIKYVCFLQKKKKNVSTICKHLHKLNIDITSKMWHKNTIHVIVQIIWLFYIPICNIQHTINIHYLKVKTIKRKKRRKCFHLNVFADFYIYIYILYRLYSRKIYFNKMYNKIKIWCRYSLVYIEQYLIFVLWCIM